MKTESIQQTEAVEEDMKDRMTWIHAELMIVGFRIGCHQRPDRSFFWKGYQFPLCARCTGVVIGYSITLPCYHLWDANVWFCIIFSAVMFVDWMIQYLQILESTNIRRLITGIMGGYSIFTLQILLFKQIVQWLII